MGLIEDLAAKVSDEYLRGEIQAAMASLKQAKRFGLVFEEHIPETATLLDYPVRPGALVELRREPSGGTRYRVTAVTNGGTRAKLTCEDGASSHVTTVPIRDLLVVKPFGEPIYPALRSVGTVERGGSKPHHAVIDAENFHALQLLVYLYRGAVDCIYIDPPYNTGARDWKYNNRYVDSNDTWRHSKWLSMMDRRLRLAKKLLKPDGVLIVTVDEHEISHLGVLLEQTFPNHLRTLITIVNNPKGTGATNFARVSEYAFFICPTGIETIGSVPFAFGMPIEVPPRDYRVVEAPTVPQSGGADSGEPALVRKLALRRDGAESSNRRDRWRQFYAILVNEATHDIVGIGPEIALDDHDFPTAPRKGVVPVYPIDSRGRHRVWRYGRQTMAQLIEAGEIRVTRFDPRRGAFSLYHYKPVAREDAERRRPRTVWWNSTHDAGAHGSNLLNTFLGERSTFPFPKSVYAVADCVRLVVQDRPEALILDFFAGSGTTLHSTCLLNAEDGGQRRCILVTNNEVDDRQTRQLQAQGLFRGDPAFDAHGIFEQVTRPRCTAAITGRRPDGSEIPGTYVDGTPFAAGFDENVEFFRMRYLDPDDVDLGHQFEAILPALWLAAGGVGPREAPKDAASFTMPIGSTYAVLCRESRFRQFREALAKRSDISHVWLVTDSDEAFSEMSSMLPGHLTLSMLYHDYLRNFRINTDRNL